MPPREIVEAMRPENFKACVIVTSSGDRYEVRHPEFVHVLRSGTIHLYEPTLDEEEGIGPFIRSGARNLAVIEPLRRQRG